MMGGRDPVRLDKRTGNGWHWEQRTQGAILGAALAKMQATRYALAPNSGTDDIAG